jgi:hypothetical protein
MSAGRVTGLTDRRAECDALDRLMEAWAAPRFPDS